MTDAISRGSWSDQFLPGADPLPKDASESMISLATIRGLIFRQRLVLVGIISIVLVIALAFTLLTRPLYKASATVRIEPEGVNIVEGQDLAPSVPGNQIDMYMNTQAAVIKSKRMAYTVVDALKLGSDADFLGEEFAGPRPQGISEKRWMEIRRDAAADMVRGGLSVDVPSDSRIVSINYVSLSAEQAARLANAFADAFVKEDVRRSIEANDYARTYLQEQIQVISGKLQQAETTANTYAKRNGIVGGALGTAKEGDTSGTAQTMTAANLTSVNEALTKLRGDRISAQQRWLAVVNVPALQLPEAQTNGAMQSLYGQRSSVTAQLSQMRQRYGDSYPQVVELKAQLASLDSQITRLGTEIKNGIRDQYEIALRQEQGLAAELQNVSTQTLDEQDRRVQYNLLDREAQALRTQMAALLDRFNQLSAAASINSGTITKLDSAEIPGAPYSPNLLKNMLVAAVIGIGLAVGIAVLREAFDDRLRSTEDVERKLGVSLLGFTPYLSDEEVAQQQADPFSALMEAYASLRTSVDFAVPGDHRIVQVTSSQPSEGKSLTSSVLARKYAQLGLKVLLIDSDLRKPTINHLFGEKRPKVGFVEVLLGDVPLADALLPNMPENLDVLPVGSIPARPVELLSSKRFSDFLAMVRNQYAIVIIDSSPVMGIADAPLIARHVDGLVFVVEANRSHYGQAKAALRRLQSAGARVSGAVLTKYRSAEAGLAYDYIYNYYSYSSDQKG